MTNEEKQDRIFHAVRYWADTALANQMCYLDEAEFFRRCKHPDLEDARCLYRMILKEVEAHNAKLKAKRSLLNKMRYTHKYLASSLFAGLNIPLKQIEKIISEHPDKNTYEIYRELISKESY